MISYVTYKGLLLSLINVLYISLSCFQVMFTFEKMFKHFKKEEKTLLSHLTYVYLLHLLTLKSFH